MVRLHRTDRRKLVTIFIIQLSRQKYCTPFYLFRVLNECTEGIVLQQSNLVDSTVTLHRHLVFRNEMEFTASGARGRKNEENVS